MRAAFPDATRRREVEAGWEDRWREFHRPVRDRPAVGRPAVGDAAGRRDRGRRSTPAARSAPARTRRRGSASSCCSTLARGERARRRLRLGRARDRGGAARLRPGRSRSTSTSSRSRRRARTPRRTASRSRRARRRARRAAARRPALAVANISLAAVRLGRGPAPLLVTSATSSPTRPSSRVRASRAPRARRLGADLFERR